MVFRVRSTDKRPVPVPWFRQYGRELDAHPVKGEDSGLWDVMCQPGPVQVGAEGFTPTEVTAHGDWFRRSMGSWFRHTHVRLSPHEKGPHVGAAGRHGSTRV